MRKNLVPRLTFLIISFFLFSQNSFADINWALLQEGNKVIFIRHALAPGSGDPDGFKINDCKTQRNLNQVGIEQSKRIGVLFKKDA